MSRLTPIAVGEKNAAKMMDMSLERFLSLVKSGSLPKPKPIAPGVERWSVALHTGRWPQAQINHINGDPSDNRITNLREVSQHDVTRNQSLHRDNNSGQSGVFQRKDTGKWVAQIGRAGSDHFQYLGGDFESFADAALARQKAEAKLGYHDNHGKRKSRR